MTRKLSSSVLSLVSSLDGVLGVCVSSLSVSYGAYGVTVLSVPLVVVVVVKEVCEPWGWGWSRVLGAGRIVPFDLTLCPCLSSLTRRSLVREFLVPAD